MEIKNNLNRLDPYLNRAELDAQATQAQKSGAKLSFGSLAAQEGDKVSLSTTALKEVVTAEAMNAPDIRQDKVNALKASLASGSYNIDSRDIASKLLGL
ncbi:MAG: flagellar biosynthesis anti-sigma factor FlgM [Deltaproteobacteria bacterium]|jgi:negative regulator of flagellin synthesis FlgM|nr:flagellar biosynthesis anti-sigma factor FlgM [Deltaproteobacteria bacterium]